MLNSNHFQFYIRYHFQAKSPSAGQFTALGIYLLTCLLVVVGAMIEFAVLIHMRRSCEHKVLYENDSSEKIHRTNSKNHSSLRNGNMTADSLLNIEKPVFLLEEAINKERRAFIYASHKIDSNALIIFGLLFSVFNCVYWIYYLFL